MEGFEDEAKHDIGPRRPNQARQAQNQNARDAVKVLMHIAKRTGWASAREHTFTKTLTSDSTQSSSNDNECHSLSSC